MEEKTSYIMFVGQLQQIIDPSIHLAVAAPSSGNGTGSVVGTNTNAIFHFNSFVDSLGLGIGALTNKRK